MSHVLPAPMSFHGLKIESKAGYPPSILFRMVTEHCPFMVSQEVYLAYERAFRANEVVFGTIISNWLASTNMDGRVVG